MPRHKHKSYGPNRRKDESEDVNNFREELGLRKIIKARIPCLRCGYMFTSKDTISNRVCLGCLNSSDTVQDWGFEIIRRDNKKKVGH